MIYNAHQGKAENIRYYIQKISHIWKSRGWLRRYAISEWLRSRDVEYLFVIYYKVDYLLDNSSCYICKPVFMSEFEDNEM